MKSDDPRRNRNLRVAVAAILLAGLSAAGCVSTDIIPQADAQTATRQPSQQAAGGLQTIQVIDQQVGIPALSVALPQGWTHQFQSTWNKDSDPMVSFSFEAKEPGGAGRFYISQSLNFYDMPQYYGLTPFFQRLQSPRDAFEYVQRLNQSDPKFRALGYRVVQSKDLPPIDVNGSRLFNSIVFADYTENGVQKQEIVNAMVLTAPPGTTWTLFWQGLSDRKEVSPEVLASRLDAISQSVQNLPQWLQKKAAVMAQWGNEKQMYANQALARSDQIRDQSINMTRQNQETLDYMLQSNRERSQARMDSMERVNQGAIDAIKNENVYRDSSGGTFRDTDKYKDIWKNSVNNERIYTDDSTYNPNADKRVNDVPWEQAQPVR